MAQQIAHFDVLPGCRRIRKISGDAAIKIDLALFHQHHDRSRCELLSDGAGLENCFRLDRNIQLNIGQPIAFGGDDLPVAINAQRDPRDVLPRQFRLNVLVNAARRRLRCCQRRSKHQQKQRTEPDNFHRARDGNTEEFF